MDKNYNKYLNEKLKGVLKTSPTVDEPIKTEFFEAPFTLDDFQKIIKTSQKAINAEAIRGGIDENGDIFAWRFDVWNRAMGEADNRKFDYVIEAIKDGRTWNIIVIPTTNKRSLDEKDIPNIDEKMTSLTNFMPGQTPINYILSKDFTGKNNEPRKIP